MDENIDITKLLTELGEQMCPSAEILSAFLEEVLPDESNLIISRHLQQCQICRQSLQILKDAASEGFLEATEEMTVPPMADAVKAKFELSAKIHSFGEAIAINVARLLLPEHSWPRIPFTIANIGKSRSKDEEPKYNKGSQQTGHAIAAFSSHSTADDHSTYCVIEHVVWFTNTLCSTLIERCSKSADILETLHLSVSDACEQFEDIPFDDKVMSVIQEIVVHGLEADE